jgi:hypothetical protein
VANTWRWLEVHCPGCDRLAESAWFGRHLRVELEFGCGVRVLLEPHSEPWEQVWAWFGARWGSDLSLPPAVLVPEIELVPVDEDER